MLRSSLGLITACVWAVAACAQSIPQTPPVLLQMIRDDSVHDELQLSTNQRDEVIESLSEIDGRWFRARNIPADKQRQEADVLTTQLRQRLAGILEQRQITRLRELGTSGIGNPHGPA